MGWLLHLRVQQLRQLTHRVCLSGARQRVTSYAVQPTTEHRRLPFELRFAKLKGTLAAGAAFSPSFLAVQKGRSPAGATSRHLRASAEKASTQAPQQKQNTPLIPAFSHKQEKE